MRLSETRFRAKAQVFSCITRLVQPYAELILLLGCFLVPLKLSLTYLFFGPAIVFWIIENRDNLTKKLKEYSWFVAPWGFFVFSVILSALFGFNPYNSLKNIYSLIFYPIVIFAIADHFIGKRALIPLMAMVSAQGIAAIHSVLETSSNGMLPRFFLGAVTESGQLALIVPLACGLTLSFLRYTEFKLKIFEQLKKAGSVALISFIFCILAYGNQLFGFTALASSVLTAVSILMVIIWNMLLSNKLVAEPLSKSEAGRYSKFFKTSAQLLELVILPLLFAALIVNLKRGPWVGVVVSLLVLSLIYSRKLVLPFLAAIALIIAIAPPVQTRLLESSRDFFIPGGRSAIWEVGLTLSERFPLGIGLKNSKTLHTYSSEIPAELTHFHNNALNILVESGPLSLILFGAWIFALLSFVFKAKVEPSLAPTVKSIGCALIAWQVAGLVEYNFGDSEVLFIVYVLLGAVAGMQSKSLSAAHPPR